MILGYYIDNVLKQPTAPPASNVSKSVQKEVNKYLRNPDLITEPRLRDEVKKKSVFFLMTHFHLILNK